ncbi:MAG: acyl carrier protein [Lentimicrobium sp.]|jgi:acyl carrier protein|nr:acyl carrier protein [Lentimicrobium sp.]MDD2527765.1 acyl carrier protein [Lentimicrobiaceae bacterium]MDD4598288.1 acyl carrier protein [Lentimicrobiaceae bacterium]HAH57115.1 acyl carrier protein [Bacteroidales bacterium]
METNFLEQLTELLEMETTVKPADKFREYENWDSLAYLSLISFVDEEYGIVIPRDEFGKMNTVQDIIDYIKNNS